MFSTCTAIPLSTQMRSRGLLARATCLAVSIAWSATAFAAVPWHRDLAAARRASETSQRPVLAIFTASWSSSSATLDRTTLASDEAVALITACFEPVCVDVDANPDATRRLGITRVPTACIMTCQDHVLAKFELPETPAGFVAAAARAVQEAAVASVARSQQTASDVHAARLPFADVPDGGGRGVTSFAGDARNPLRTAAGGDIRGTVPPGGQAINAVAAKVRMLSDFASDPQARVGANDSIAASFREPPFRDTAFAPTTPPAGTALTPPVDAGRPADTVASAAQAAPELPAETVAPAPAAPPVTAPAAAIAASSLPEPTAQKPPQKTAPAASPLAGTVAQKPLSIEPMPNAATPAPARSAPWLGLPQREQVATAPAPATADAPRSPAAAPRPPAASQLAAAPTGQAPAATAAPSAIPAPAAKPEQPSAGGQAAALADSKPRKPTPSTTSSLLSAIQKPFSMFSKPTAAKPDAPKPAAQSTAVAATTPNTTAAEPDSW